MSDYNTNYLQIYENYLQIYEIYLGYKSKRPAGFWIRVIFLKREELRRKNGGCKESQNEKTTDSYIFVILKGKKTQIKNNK